MAEQRTASAGFNGCTIQFYYDDVTLAVTRCEASVLPSGWCIRATATPEAGDPWSCEFHEDGSIDVEGVSFTSSDLDGVTFSFERIDP